jgi:hypothetical protein
MSPVDEAVSQHWTWQECGRIPPDLDDELRHPGYAITSLAVSADGSLLLSNDGVTIAWRVATPFANSQPLWRLGGEGTYNVALSPDARLGTMSGDLRMVFDVATGELLKSDGTDGFAYGLTACIGSEFNFSSDARFIAGKHYTNIVDVFRADDLTIVGHFATTGCAQGVVFSEDGSRITTPDGSVALAELLPTAPAMVESPRNYDWQSLTRAPDGSLVATSCNYAVGSCAAAGVVWSKAEGGKHLSISAEGHWYALGGQLRHQPSGEQRLLDDAATETIFTPNGDVIVGEQDGNLVRFCRYD